jgi:hypothetical protein
MDPRDDYADPEPPPRWLPSPRWLAILLLAATLLFGAGIGLAAGWYFVRDALAD